MSVYLLSTCVEPCIAYFFPVKKPERQTLEMRNIPCLDVFSKTDRWEKQEYWKALIVSQERIEL